MKQFDTLEQDELSYQSESEYGKMLNGGLDADI